MLGIANYLYISIKYGLYHHLSEMSDANVVIKYIATLH